MTMLLLCDLFVREMVGSWRWMGGLYAGCCVWIAVECSRVLSMLGFSNGKVQVRSCLEREWTCTCQRTQ